MPDILLALVTLTLGGSAAILILSLVSRSTRFRYGARWRCWAWLVLGLRLALPFPLLPHGEDTSHTPIQLPAPSDTTIFTQQPQAPVAPPPTGGGILPDSPHSVVSPPEQSTSAPSVSQPPAAPERQEESFSLSLSQAALLVWLAGAVVMLVWTLAAHLRFLLYLRRWSEPVQDGETVGIFNTLGDRLGLDRRPRLMRCTGLQAPMLAGLLRPALLLPPELEGDPLRYSLLHELTHCRRRDIWLKALTLWVNIVHWFNPAVWYMMRLVERDTELACDEEALRLLPRAEHAAYGRTILDAAERLQKRAF